MKSLFRIPAKRCRCSDDDRLRSAAAGLRTGGRPQPIVAWSAQPNEPTPWIAPNKPHWKLSEVLAKHAGQRSWSEDIVSDRDFIARYIAMAPGEKTKPQFYADDRVFWIVQ